MPLNYESLLETYAHRVNMLDKDVEYLKRLIRAVRREALEEAEQVANREFNTYNSIASTEYRDGWNAGTRSIRLELRALKSEDTKSSHEHHWFQEQGEQVYCRICGATAASKDAKPEPRPEYYYVGESGTRYTDQDPEVTCKHCKRTFRTDAFDACCRLCGKRFN